MTSGYYVVLHFPYEGVLLEEFHTKREAELKYIESQKDVDSEYLLGVALIHIDEIVKEKGEWK